MDANQILKYFLIAVVVIAILPFAVRLLPEAVTFDRALAAFKAAGMDVQDYRVAEHPGMESVAQADMRIDGAWVNLYEYDDEGVIVRNLEYRKKDAGTAIVETWNLAQTLGAAPSVNKPERSARNGMFMIVATGEDEALLKKIVTIFADL